MATNKPELTVAHLQAITNGINVMMKNDDATSFLRDQNGIVRNDLYRDVIFWCSAMADELKAKEEARQEMPPNG